MHFYSGPPMHLLSGVDSNFNLNSDTCIGGPRPQANIGLLFLDDMRLALNRIGPALLQTQPLGDSILDSGLASQVL
jgi:hypothetical protein